MPQNTKPSKTPEVSSEQALPAREAKQAPPASEATQAPPASEAEQTLLSVMGMHCASCVAHVESALNQLPEVTRAEVSLKLEQAKVYTQYDPDAHAHRDVDVDQLIKTVESAGFTATVVHDHLEHLDHLEQPSDTNSQGRANRQPLILIMAGMATFYLLLGDYWQAINTGYWGQLLLAGLVQYFLGTPFYGGMLRALKAKKWLHKSNMDTLIAIGSTTAFIAFMCGQPDQHYAEEPLAAMSHFHAHTSAMILLFISFGKYLEKRSLKAAGRVIDTLIAMTPETVTKVNPTASSPSSSGGIPLSVLSSPALATAEIEKVAVQSIQVDDTIRFVEGDRVVVDGPISRGQASLDTSSLTGESLPVSVSKGDEVISGSLILEGMIEVTVARAGQETSLSNLIELMKSAAFSKAPVQRLADRVAGVFVPVILLLAIATFLMWSLMGNPGEGLFASVALLVVACPCALGLAVPTTLTVASGLAARSGFLVKDLKMLEIANRVQDIYFDKTGTLTYGKLNVHAMIWHQNTEVDEKLDEKAHQKTPQKFDELSNDEKQAIQDVLLQMTERSQHPVSQAIQQYLTSLKKDVDGDGKGNFRENFRGNFQGGELSEYQSIPGAGLSATSQNESYRLGSGEWLSLDDVGTVNGSMMQVHLVRGEKHLLSFQLSDQLREESAEVMTQLKDMGRQLHLVSGDRLEVAKSIADTVGIDNVHAGVMPAKKLKLVSCDRPASDGSQSVMTMMVGDGINDSGALMSAGIGVAMGGGSDLAMQAGDVIVTSEKLHAIPAILNLAKWTRRHLYSGLFWALIYNVILIPLAAAGKMPPALAAAAMGLSSVCVVLNALLLRASYGRRQM